MERMEVIYFRKSADSRIAEYSDFLFYIFMEF